MEIVWLIEINKKYNIIYSVYDFISMHKRVEDKNIKHVCVSSFRLKQFWLLHIVYMDYCPSMSC